MPDANVPRKKNVVKTSVKQNNVSVWTSKNDVSVDMKTWKVCAKVVKNIVNIKIRNVGGGWWWETRTHSWEFTWIPEWQVFDNATTYDVVQTWFQSKDPSISWFSLSPAAWTREVWDNVVNPTINVSYVLWSNPVSNIDLIEFFRGAVWWTLIDSQNPPAWPWSANFQDSNVVSSNQTYSTRLTDWEWRQDTAQSSYSFIYPYFYGVVTWSTRPAADQALINSWNKVISWSNGTVRVNFVPFGEWFCWLAIPATSTSKTRRYVTDANQWWIWNPTDLFPDEQVASVQSPTWLRTPVNYKVYITALPTTFVLETQFRNS